MRRYYIKDGRFMVQERPGILVKCQIPGCDQIMPEEDLFVHEVGHPDPVIPKPRVEMLVTSVDEEGVHSVTSLGEE